MSRQGGCNAWGREYWGPRDLDSRGNPTVEVEVCLEGGITERAAVTYGASTGSFEAHELRDGDERYRGEGVCKAVRNVCEEISGYLAGTESTRQIDIDNMLIELDGTEDKSRLGANAMLVGFACRGPGFRGFPECPLHGYLGVLLVGDDLLATNAGRLRRGIREKAANAILVKLNQIGTLTETLEVIRVAGEADFKRIVAHRSGETEDTSIADLAVATNCAFIKSGAPARTGESV